MNSVTLMGIMTIYIYLYKKFSNDSCSIHRDYNVNVDPFGIHHSFDFKLLISFSNFIAFCKLPSIFNFPVMNAEAGFTLPLKEKNHVNKRCMIKSTHD